MTPTAPTSQSPGRDTHAARGRDRPDSRGTRQEMTPALAALQTLDAGTGIEHARKDMPTVGPCHAITPTRI